MLPLRLREEVRAFFIFHPSHVMRVQEECAHGESGEGGDDSNLGGKCLLTCELVLMCVGA